MIILILIEYLWPITYLAGLVVTIRYFRKHGKAVLIMLLLYFVLGVYSHTLSPHVERLFWPKAAEFTPEQMEKYEEYQKEAEELQLKHFGEIPGSIATVVKRVSIPFGQILLVAMLFLLGKRIEKDTQQSGAAYPPQGVGSADP